MSRVNPFTGVFYMLHSEEGIWIEFFNKRDTRELLYLSEMWLKPNKRKEYNNN